MVVLNFLCVLVSLVFFRSANVHDAVYLLGTMSGIHGVGAAFGNFAFLEGIPTTSKFLVHISTTLLTLALCFFIVWALPNTQEILGQLRTNETRMPSLLPRLTWRPTAVWSVGLAALFCVAILLLDASTRFLYFQF